jgi:hypothetical protein
VRAHPGPTDWGQGHYGVIRKLHPRGAATRGVLLGRLRSYEHRGSARQTGLRPCDGKQNELRIREKTRRDSEVRAHPGPRVWVAWPLRGNQEAPSQTGGYAKCSSRQVAFVRAPWAGPPNRASPMRGSGIVLGTYKRRAGRRSLPADGLVPTTARRWWGVGSALRVPLLRFESDQNPCMGEALFGGQDLYAHAPPHTFRERSQTLAWAKPCLAGRPTMLVRTQPPEQHTSRGRPSGMELPDYPVVALTPVRRTRMGPHFRFPPGLFPYS